MGRTKEELKEAACRAIDAHRDDIIAFGDSIFAEPELGYKEVKTSEKFQKLLDSLGFAHQDHVALTGVIANFKGKESKMKVALMGELDAVVTGPFDKETVQSDEFGYTGHTEYFGAELEGEPMMIMCSDRLRVGLVTKHIPVSEIARSISKEKIVRDLATLRRSLVEDFGVVEPRIAVMALNPHAGDGGLVGREEEETIRPAIVEAFGQGILAFGPFAADGLFAGGGYTRYDGILAMYHDQGLAPFKTLSPDGVNFTAGLAAVRTSPDHGVAFDIAGKDQADPQSMRNAIYAAIDIVRHRRARAEWTANPLQRAEREKSNRDVSVKDLPQTDKE